MTDQIKDKTFRNFFITSLLICTCFAFFLFHPHIYGDSSAYIKLAKDFLGQIEFDKGYRSPLYSFMLAGLLKYFGESNYLKIAVYIQYIMIFIASIIIYKIFEKIIDNKKVIFLIGILYLFNLSTISYGFSILTETLTTLLYILLVYMVLNSIDSKNEKIYYSLMGVVTALLILARYNTFFMPIWVILSIVYFQCYLRTNRRLKDCLARMMMYLIPLILIVNVWCIRNFIKFDFYFLFPASGLAVSRNLLLVALDDELKVPDKCTEVKRIMLNSKQKLLSRKITRAKGSLLGHTGPAFNNMWNKLQGGYLTYAGARIDLLKYYRLEGLENSEFLLSVELTDFYKEIANQNKLKVFLLRLFSTVYSFKDSQSGLSPEYKYNINVLPPIVFIVFKIFFLFSMACFILLTGVYLIKILKNKSFNSYYSSVVILWFIIYFPIINFMYGTMHDAARFKFPSEPLMFELLIFYLYEIRENYKLKTTKMLSKISIR